MSVEENWLGHLKKLVQDNSKAGDKRSGYRAVAEASGLSEEYIYQLVEGKKKPTGVTRYPGAKAAKALARAFAEGRPLGWIDLPLDTQSSDAAMAPGSGHILVSKAELAAAVYLCIEQSAGMDAAGFSMATEVLISLGVPAKEAGFHLHNAPAHLTAKTAAEQATPARPTPPKPAAGASQAPQESAKE